MSDREPDGFEKEVEEWFRRDYDGDPQMWDTFGHVALAAALRFGGRVVAEGTVSYAESFLHERIHVTSSVKDAFDKVIVGQRVRLVVDEERNP